MEGLMLEGGGVYWWEGFWVGGEELSGGFTS